MSMIQNNSSDIKLVLYNKYEHTNVKYDHTYGENSL